MRLLFRGDQIDVVCDQELACAGHRGAPRRHELSRAVIRFPFIEKQLVTQAFVLAGANLWHGVTIVEVRGVPVEEDGHLVDIEEE